jgi:hypothetical protein
MFQVDMTATYTGSLTGSPASAGTDSFTVDVYDGIFDPGPGSWAGSYTNGSGNTVGWPTLGSGSSFSENLYWDGMAVGEVGPFSTPGYSYQSVTKTLDFGATNDAAANLNGDYRFNFTFGAGSATGAFDTFATPVPSSTLSDVGPTTPEPRATLPILGLMAIGVVLMRVRSGRSLGGEQL